MGFLIARLVVAVAILAAIVAQLRSSVNFVNRAGQSGDTRAVITNFFSYFTIDSNSLSVVVLLVGAGYLARRMSHEPELFSTVRLAVATYMIITGVVYNLLLRNEALPQGAVVAWSNEVLHVVGPAYLAIDWFFAPGRHRLRSRDALPALAFPIVWVIYTLIRGPFAHDPYRSANHWYPYPFLNPVTLTGGYATVTAYVIGIAAVIIAVAFGLTWITRRWPGPAAA